MGTPAQWDARHTSEFISADAPESERPLPFTGLVLTVLGLRR